MKRCRTCGETKPLEQFGHDKRRPDGRGSYCSACHNARQRTRKKGNHQPPAVGERQCSTCGETKPLSEFPRRKDSPVGFRSACRPCWREATRLASQRWTEANPDRALERARQWRERNREQELERTRRYHKEHREQRRVAIAASRAADPEHHRALLQAWRQANPHKMRDAWYRWHEGTKDPSPATAAYIAILLSDPCSYCGKPVEHIDHVIARSAGGPHEWTNLTASCGSCNASKGNKPLLVWLA